MGKTKGNKTSRKKRLGATKKKADTWVNKKWNTYEKDYKGKKKADRKQSRAKDEVLSITMLQVKNSIDIDTWNLTKKKTNFIFNRFSEFK